MGAEVTKCRINAALCMIEFRHFERSSDTHGSF